MSIKVPNIITKPTFPRKIAKQLASDGFIPVIALEAFVEAGRTYQAHKRGGFDEARERITEEFSGAVFWLGGITGLNILFEKLGRKLLNLKDIDFSIAKDNVRNPLANYLENETTKNGGKILENTIAKFRFVKVISSVLIANAFIGFILPKINQRITRWYHRNDKNQPTQATEPVNNQTINSFINNKSNTNNKNNDVSFGMNLLTLANNFETNRNYKLLATDVGTASGRAYSARNNDERIEILFRDISSSYFYMFNMALLNKLFNKIEQSGTSRRLDAVSAQFASQYGKNYLEDIKSDSVDVAKFEQDMMGKKVNLPDSLKAKFKDTGIIPIDDFNKELESIIPQDKLAEYKDIAKKMSELQPTIKGQAILTKAQAKDIFKGGHINNPEFLKAFYENAIGKKFLDSYDYIAQKELDKYKADLENYIKSIIEDAKKNGGKVTANLIEKASKKNLKLNLTNWGLGFAVSATFLSTLIPKMQYAITKFRTGTNNFPGTAQYKKEQAK